MGDVIIRKRLSAGAVGAWITGFLALFIIIISYVAITPVINTLIGTLSNQTSDQTVINLFNQLSNVWHYLPLVLVLAVIIYIIISSARREPYDEYY